MRLRSRGGLRGRFGGRLRGALHLRRELSEGRRTRNRQLRQALSIQRDTGLFEAADELAVSETVLARGRVDPDHPQTPEVAFLAAAAHERILERRVDRLLCSAIEFTLVGVIAFCQPKQLLSLGAADRSSLYSWHLLS